MFNITQHKSKTYTTNILVSQSHLVTLHSRPMTLAICLVWLVADLFDDFNDVSSFWLHSGRWQTNN